MLLVDKFYTSAFYADSGIWTTEKRLLMPPFDHLSQSWSFVGFLIINIRNSRRISKFSGSKQERILTLNGFFHVCYVESRNYYKFLLIGSYSASFWIYLLFLWHIDKMISMINNRKQWRRKKRHHSLNYIVNRKIGRNRTHNFHIMKPVFYRGATATALCDD